MVKLSYLKESVKLKFAKRNFIRKYTVYGLQAGLAALIIFAPLAGAQSYDSQIRELREENNSATEKVEDLEVSGQTLAEKIAALRARISEIEKQISNNQAKQSRLRAKTVKLKKEIAEQRETLKVNIKQLYIESDMSTLEQLASSGSFSDFVDKEQYRISVQNKITANLERIRQLKAEVEKQNRLIKKLLTDQENMRDRANKDRAETQRLLSLNEEQQDEYAGTIAANSNKIKELQRLQAEENARLLQQQWGAAQVGAANFTGSIKYVNGHAYPWANVYFPNSIADPWGMYKRQCVSYTAWKVASSGRHMPYWGGRGNAKLWDDNARAAGIPVDGNPRVGDVAVSNNGYYGHVMYVEAVHGDGTISISQYNAGWTGTYSEARISAAGLAFIHF